MNEIIALLPILAFQSNFPNFKHIQHLLRTRSPSVSMKYEERFRFRLVDLHISLKIPFDKAFDRSLGGKRILFELNLVIDDESIRLSLVR